METIKWKSVLKISMHVHFISSGENIHNTFPTTLRSLNGITDVVIVVEESIFQDDPNDSPHLKETKPKLRESIEGVCEICEKARIHCTVARTPDTTLECVRDSILPLTVNRPDAKLSFNLSGGTKMLTLSLYTLAIWLDGDVYLTPRSGNFEHFSIPKMHLNDVRDNPNLTTALFYLGDNNVNNSTFTEEQNWKLGKDFARYMKNNYTPKKSEDDRKMDRKPNRSSISKFIFRLEEWDLIEERVSPKSKREKEYRITRDGLFALAILRAEMDVPKTP